MGQKMSASIFVKFFTSNMMSGMNVRLIVQTILCLASLAASASNGMERIAISANGDGFVSQPSNQPFHPWGNNYGNKGRLIEDFWQTNWFAVVDDFRDMKRMGANVVRVHLQFGKFMLGPDRLNPDALAQLSRLLQLAESNGLYLDLTGLACYRKADVPAWYDTLSESARWASQAKFWEGIAAQCAQSPAVFCYDLINEPIVAGGTRKPGDWYTGELGGLNFIQFINLDQKERPREKIAREWVTTMVKAIHKHDRRHLITLGIIPPPKGWGSFSAFEPKGSFPRRWISSASTSIPKRARRTTR